MNVAARIQCAAFGRDQSGLGGRPPVSDRITRLRTTEWDPVPALQAPGVIQVPEPFGRSRATAEQKDARAVECELSTDARHGTAPGDEFPLLTIPCPCVIQQGLVRGPAAEQDDAAIRMVGRSAADHARRRT
jgi:hypothetical protein